MPRLAPKFRQKSEFFGVWAPRKAKLSHGELHVSIITRLQNDPLTRTSGMKREIKLLCVIHIAVARSVNKSDLRYTTRLPRTEHKLLALPIFASFAREHSKAEIYLWLRMRASRFSDRAAMTSDARFSGDRRELSSTRLNCT